MDPTALVWLHFVSDFLLQTDQMALNKSKSWKWLGIHCLAYISPFLLLCGWQYALVNFVAHFLTDALSSRATSMLWRMNARHWFFVVIGLDQALHMTVLFKTTGLIK